MGYNATYGYEKNDTLSFLATDPVTKITSVKAEYRVNKKERPFIRTRTEK